jgi:hypothetical protein
MKTDTRIISMDTIYFTDKQPDIEAPPNNQITRDFSNDNFKAYYTKNIISTNKTQKQNINSITGEERIYRNEFQYVKNACYQLFCCCFICKEINQNIKFLLCFIWFILCLFLGLGIACLYLYFSHKKNI